MLKFAKRARSAFSLCMRVFYSYLSAQVFIQQKEDGESGIREAEVEQRPTYREAIELMKRAGMSRLGQDS